MEKWITHLRNEKEDITMTSVEYDTRKEAEKFAKKITEKYSGFTKWKIYSSKDGVDNRPVTERIKTYEDACRELDIPLTPERCKGMTEDESAYYSLKVIAKALNEGWEPDWSNDCQEKWYPWFSVTNDSPAGLSYSYTSNAVSKTTASFGSRLCFKTEVLAEYAGTQFIKLYEKYLL
jgi:hypothetical protein